MNQTSRPTCIGLTVLGLLIIGTTTSCDSGQVVQNAQLALTVADTARATAGAWIENQHAAGKIDDEKMEKWTTANARLSTTIQTLRLTLAEYESTKGKPLAEKIGILIGDLNQIITQINAMIEAWK